MHTIHYVTDMDDLIRHKKGGMFSFEYITTNRSLDIENTSSRHVKSKNIKPGGYFDKGLETAIDDLQFLLEFPNIAKELFENNRKRYLRFGDLIDLINVFDELDTRSKRVHPFEKFGLHWYDRQPGFTLVKLKKQNSKDHQKYKLIPIKYTKSEYKTMTKGKQTPIFFINAMKRGSNLPEKQWKFLETMFELENKLVGSDMPYLIPLKPNKEYRWSEIKNAFEQYLTNRL